MKSLDDIFNEMPAYQQMNTIQRNDARAWAHFFLVLFVAILGVAFSMVWISVGSQLMVCFLLYFGSMLAITFAVDDGTGGPLRWDRGIPVMIGVAILVFFVITRL